jgi:UDPglucose--hexose-1-phosphate uridylyltransferase
LCPGNLRANGAKNPDYKETFVFENDFPALANNFQSSKQGNISELIKFEETKGLCRVVCFSSKHNLTFADMSEIQIKNVINVWINQLKDLRKKYKWIQIFENKGAMMGCSNSHPHGQIWASNFIPSEIIIEDKQQKKYYIKNHSNLLIDYLKLEIKLNKRIVAENSNWAALVPFWAVWPYEIMILPKKHQVYFDDLDPKNVSSLSEIMKLSLTAYDRIFQTDMPYSMGWHFAPYHKAKSNKHWQLHAHYYPPLLRSSTVKKFMVGYEMLAEAQRDITPEEAAGKLKAII